jgi:hypothetical protein
MQEVAAEAQAAAATALQASLATPISNKLIFSKTMLQFALNLYQLNSK